jgi:hypothetical protein
MRRLLIFAAAATLLAAGCGGSEESSPLRQTADHLGDIHSGTLSLDFSLTPAGSPKGVGVQLQGPFSLQGKGPLPIARISYAQRAGATRRATFVSNGRQAYVATGGRTVRLSPQQLSGLRVGAGQKRSLDDLGLHVDRWVQRPKVAAGPRLDGKETQRITGTLDAKEALADLARASGGASGLSQADAKRLSRTVSGSAVEIVSGKDDHLLRRLRLSVNLAVPPDLRAKVGGKAGLRVLLRLGIARPNARQ